MRASRARSRAQALAEGIPDSEATIVALARSVLEAPTIRAAADGRSWREVPVAAEIDGTTIEGFIDLLIADGDDLVVVDYKTDTARTDAEVDAALERYRYQGAAYALALEAVLGRSVSRCVFVFARTRGPAVEREVADLRGWSTRSAPACPLRSSPRHPTRSAANFEATEGARRRVAQ